MRRLNGRGEVEKIVFGRELYMLRLRRAVATVVIFAALLTGAVFTTLMISRGVENGSGPPDTDGENKIDAGGSGEEDNGQNGVDNEEKNHDEENGNSGGAKPPENSENPIIYKDFGTSQINVVNNTVFDISFVNSTSSGLVKYYDKSSERPIVLILHTFTSDRYCDSGARYGVCTVGRVLAQELSSMGIGAVYSSAVHDASSGDPYKNSRETIEFYLKMYPSIKYVFDVGVMQEYEGDRIVATSGNYLGKKAAQIRLLVAGNNLSSNRENLLLACAISKNLSRGEMNLAREIVYDDSIKNSSITPYYLEIFIGSSGNTEGEAMISAQILAYAFAEFLAE